MQNYNKNWGFSNFNLPVGENNTELRSFVEKLESYSKSYNHFLNLALSIFKIENLEKYNINQEYFLRVLFENGAITVTRNSNVGLVAVPFSVNGYNYQGLPSSWNATPLFESSEILKIPTLNNDNAVIVYLNKSHTGLFDEFTYFSRLSAMLLQLYNNNLYSKSLQLVLEGKRVNNSAFDEILDTIFNQSGFLKISTEAGDTAQDMLKFVSNNCDFLAREIDDALHNLENRFLSRLGIPHVPYEKKGHINVDEVHTQDFACDLIRMNFFETIQSGLKKVNEKFDTNLIVKFSVDFDKKDNDENDVGEVTDNFVFDEEQKTEQE